MLNPPVMPFAFVAAAILAASAAPGFGADPAAFADFDKTSDPEQISVALKYVSFVKADGIPVLSPEEAKKSVRTVNQLYAQCHVRFLIQDYVIEDPAPQRLAFSLHSMEQLEPIRTRFGEKDRLVISFTGPWDHKRIGPANAWTTMPGSSPPGAVLESAVAGDPEIVAHELGHYLGLDHVADQADLMNPIIYKTSTYLSPEQCGVIRETASNSWKSARR